EEGDGAGPIAEYLWPRPRDFVAASFKLRTTMSGELPIDEDLYRTITRGIPGTSMPAWGSFLTPEERWQVISYIKTFAGGLFEDEMFDPYLAVIDLPATPAVRIDSVVAAGRQAYDDADCWECHGAVGRGDGERAGELTDDWDMPIQPANLHLAWKFKGGSSLRSIYLRLSSGLDGTPMPSYSETTTDDERWALAYYLSSFHDNRDSDEPSSVIIKARRVEGELPGAVNHPAWDEIEDIRIPLTGQATYAPRWQVPAVTDLSVRVLFNETEVALRLSWDDRFADTAAVDSARAAVEGWQPDDTYPVLYPDNRRVRGAFADAVEVMLPVRYDGSPVLPHMVYGSVGQSVDLWRWSADRQYGSNSASAVTELRAGGIQSPPQPHAAESQRTVGWGEWRDGRWTVVIRRPLVTADGDREAQLGSDQLVPVAFHVWEGSNGETGLRMAISSWYFIQLPTPVTATSYLLILFAALGVGGIEYALIRWMSARADREQGVPSSVGGRSGRGDLKTWGR
ncbi:MAG: ethylbenzene dehydrogenase-related protein, partial [Gemmatimonadales bacterium]